MLITWHACKYIVNSNNESLSHRYLHTYFILASCGTYSMYNFNFPVTKKVSFTLKLSDTRGYSTILGLGVFSLNC